MKMYFPRLLIVIFLSNFFLCSCSKTGNESGETPLVIVAPAITKDINETMEIVGQVVAKEKVSLYARVQGFLIKRDFNQGSFVKKGQLLFQIEKSLYKAKVEAAKARLQTAEANYRTACIDYDRQKYLVSNSAVSKRNFDLAANQKAITAAKILECKATLSEAELNLSYTDIIAPFNGRVGLSEYSVGNWVSPMISEPLATLVMVDPIKVEFNIDEAMITSIIQYELQHGKRLSRKGDSPSIEDVIVKIKLSNGTMYDGIGKIDFIDNVINSMTGTITMRAEFTNPNFILIPGAYVTVKIGFKEKFKRIIIPQAAIQEDQTGSFVMLVSKDNKVERKNVNTGSAYGTYIVVSEGLKEGDLVIQEGLQKVRDGSSVKTKKAAAPKFPDEIQEDEKKDSKSKQDNKKTDIDTKSEEDSGKIEKKEVKKMDSVSYNSEKKVDKTDFVDTDHSVRETSSNLKESVDENQNRAKPQQKQSLNTEKYAPNPIAVQNEKSPGHVKTSNNTGTSQKSEVNFQNFTN